MKSNDAANFGLSAAIDSITRCPTRRCMISPTPKNEEALHVRRASSCLKEGKNSGLVNGLAKDDAYFFFLPAFFFAGAFFLVFAAIETSLWNRLKPHNCSLPSLRHPPPHQPPTSQLRRHYKNDGPPVSIEEWHFGNFFLNPILLPAGEISPSRMP